MTMTQNLINDYSVSKKETSYAISKKDNKEIVLDLRIKDPFEEMPSIPVDTKTMYKRYDNFIEQVQEQQFLVFMNEAKQYFNNADLTLADVSNPLIKSRLENDLNLKIMSEKSGFKPLNDDSSKEQIKENMVLNNTDSETEIAELKVPIEKLFINFEQKN